MFNKAEAYYLKKPEVQGESAHKYPSPDYIQVIMRKQNVHKVTSMLQRREAGFPVLLFDCLKRRLDILEPFAESGQHIIIATLSDISSEMFDLLYENLKRQQTKVTSDQLTQLNSTGQKCVQWTTQALKIYSNT